MLKWFAAYGYGTLSVVLISLCAPLGLFVVHWAHTPAFKLIMATMLGLAVGTLAGDALLHLLPHVSRYFNSRIVRFKTLELSRNQSTHTEPIFTKRLQKVRSLSLCFIAGVWSSWSRQWRHARTRRRRRVARERIRLEKFARLPCYLRLLQHSSHLHCFDRKQCKTQEHSSLISLRSLHVLTRVLMDWRGIHTEVCHQTTANKIPNTENQANLRKLTSRNVRKVTSAERTYQNQPKLQPMKRMTSSKWILTTIRVKSRTKMMSRVEVAIRKRWRHWMMTKHTWVCFMKQ